MVASTIMAHEQLTSRQVADYLHMDLREVEKLASRGKIPCRRARGDYVFIKSQVDHWVETRMHELGGDRLADIERGVSAHHGFEEDERLICPMIPAGGISVPLKGRTKAAVIRQLVDLADQAQMIYDRANMIEQIEKREELCSTALIPGVAIPHPRNPLPYDIAASFVIVGLTPSGVPFDAIDGSLTRLFFLICCKDDRTHLHVLARLGRMLERRENVDALMQAQDAEELASLLDEIENKTIGQ